ncbi:hypothetical protein ACVVI9_005318, partial [Escherichia coli]
KKRASGGLTAVTYCPEKTNPESLFSTWRLRQRVRGRSLRTEKAYHMTDLTQDCTANKRGDRW